MNIPLYGLIQRDRVRYRTMKSLEKIIADLLPVKEGQEVHHIQTRDPDLDSKRQEQGLTRMKKINKKPRYKGEEADWRK